MFYKKIALFVFVMICLNLNVQAQIGRYFNLYGKDSVNEAFIELTEIKNTLYVVGWYNDFKGRAQLSKIDAVSGSQKLKITYQLNDSIPNQDLRGILYLNNNIYTIGGCLYPDTTVEQNQKVHPYLMKTDTNGNILWWKKYEGIFEEYGGGQQILQLDSNKLAILCWARTQRNSSAENRVVIILTDTNGVLLKKVIYAPFQRKLAYAIDMVQLNDGSLLLVGSNPYFNGWAKGVAMRIDTALNIIWAKEYNSQDQVTLLQHAAQKKNGKILIAGYMNYSGTTNDYDGLLLEVNLNNGNIIRDKRFEPEFANFFDGIVILPDEKIVIGGGTDNLDTLSSDAAIWKLDSNWNVIWYHIYSQPYLGNCFSAENPYSFRRTKDGGFVFAGFTRNPVTCSQDGMIIKLDSNGCLQQGCSFVGTEDEQIWKSEIRIYPNPANEVLNIENASAYTWLKLYTMQGSLIYTKLLQFEKEIINLSEINAGLYMLQIENTQGIIQQERLVITR